MSHGSPVVVFGRFPPPMDGQTIATERCATLLDPDHRVIRVTTEHRTRTILRATPTFSVRRTLQFLRDGGRLRREINEAPGAPVLWHAASPDVLGHVRDVLVSAPALGELRRVAAVFHRATLDDLHSRPYARPSLDRLLARVGVVVFLTRSLANRCASFVPADKVWIIPNTTREAIIASPAELRRRREARSERPLQILFLSNMLPEKGYLDVLDALGHLTAQGVDARASFVGHWPSASDARVFHERVEALGIANRVDPVIALADANDVRKAYLAADLLVLPTYHPTEAQPLTLVEALATGTPVVSVDRDVVRDILTDDVEGRLVPPRDGAAIASAVRALARPEPWQRASQAARARFDTTFSPDVVAAHWRRLVAHLSGTVTLR